MLPNMTPVGMPVDPDAVPGTAELAEQLGFDSVWVGDHTFHPTQWQDMVVSLAFAAARTTRIGIGTCVLVLPVHRLPVIAKQLATLATLSRGRLRVSIGVGGEIPAEYEAAGVPLDERAARIEEGFPLLRRLLAGEAVDETGRFHRLPGVALSPVPPPIPLMLSGHRRAALDRAGRIADGWMGFLQTVDDFGRARERIETARRQAGRTGEFRYGLLIPVRVEDDNDGAARRGAEDLDRIRVWRTSAAMGATEERKGKAPQSLLERCVVAGPPAAIAEQLLAYADAGCRTFVMSPTKPGEAGRRDIEILGRAVLPELRGVCTTARRQAGANRVSDDTMRAPG